MASPSEVVMKLSFVLAVKAKIPLATTRSGVLSELCPRVWPRVFSYPVANGLTNGLV